MIDLVTKNKKLTKKQMKTNKHQKQLGKNWQILKK